jgi:AcrR family transcriptional regulator
VRLKDENKQLRIKEAMVRLILREGINGASISKIAKEAGVSPATIYVYYSNKDELLSEVYQEYSRKSYRYLKDMLQEDMDAASLLETIVRGYYQFSIEHEDVFSFVEQCSRCPSLARTVAEEECCCDIFDILRGYQSRNEISTISDMNMAAILFAPIRFLAMNRQYMSSEPEVLLDELSRLMKQMLIG